jgi:cobalt/nickel transport protein
MKISNRKFFAAALLVSALLAGVVSFYASSSPDGLEKVAEDVGFIETAKEHTFGDFTLSDYGISGLENARLSVGFAGLIGVVVTALISMGLVYVNPKESTYKKSII